MAGFSTRVLIFAGALAVNAAAPGVHAEEKLNSGALYPPDVMMLARADNKNSADDKNLTPLSAKPETSPSPRLARALGPAGAVLRNQTAKTEFQRLIRDAVGRHPTFHAQVSTLGETRAARKRARAALYPQLSTQLRSDFSLSSDFAADTNNVVESLQPNERYSAAISASQLVYDGGATFQRIKSAKARHSEFKNALSTRINDLALAALAAYHDALTHQALTALGNAYVARHEKILGDVKERERLGAGSRADVTRANARLAAARARAAEIRESKGMAEVRYAEFFRQDPINLTRPAISHPNIGSRDGAVNAALISNPEVAAAMARADASRADYKAARASRLPELRASVDAVKYDLFDNGDDFDVRAGIDLSYNIFNGGARAADISEARAKATQAKFGESQIREEIARDAAIAYERRTGAEARLAALAEAVIAHDITRELTLERYRVSRGDLIDVLQSENDYFEAAAGYLTGLANRDMAIYGLMEHTGDLARHFSPQAEFAEQYERGR